MHNQENGNYLVVIDGQEEHYESTVRFTCLKALRTGASIRIMVTVYSGKENTLFSSSNDDANSRNIGQGIAKSVLDIANNLLEDSQASRSVKITCDVSVGNPIDLISKVIEEDNVTFLIFNDLIAEGKLGSKGFASSFYSAMRGKLNIPSVVVPIHLTNQQILKLV